MSGTDRRSAVALTTSAVILPFMRAGHATMSATVLDDCARGDGTTLIGTHWEGFTDRVMGGRSRGGMKPDTIDGRACLRLTGRVDTRGGGFVQMAVDLAANGKARDASGMTGIECDVFGNDETYNAHLRTTDVGWYDQSYRATFSAPRRWTTVRLPWEAFIPSGLTTPLRTDRLLRLGLLGWMRDFDVDLAIGRLALY